MVDCEGGSACVENESGGAATCVAIPTEPVADADVPSPDADIHDAGIPVDASDVGTPDGEVAPPQDLGARDAPPAYQVLVDDTFDDFVAGSLSEAGAKLYVSATGNIQRLDRLDVNRDGHIDLLFTNLSGASYLYWGSATGYSAGDRLELESTFAESGLVADFDDDGFVDVAIGCRVDTSGDPAGGTVLIYWGDPSGLGRDRRTVLPVGASVLGLATADLNRDGFLDLVAARRYDGMSFDLDSFVYWGSPAGYDGDLRIGLPTHGAGAVAIADLDDDSWLDLVIANAATNSGGEARSFVYWGGSDGYSSDRRLSLPTDRAVEVAVADLDNDSHLDIVLARGIYGAGNVTESHVYWGDGGATFVARERTSVATMNASAVCAAHLDGDAWIDLVFTSRNNYFDGAFHVDLDSYVYFGAPHGYTEANRVGLPTAGGEGCLAADLNEDGFVDIAFGNAGSTEVLDSSFVYWGGAAGYSVSRRATLPSLHATHSIQADMGSVRDRRPIEVFTSRVLDTGTMDPEYDSIEWMAETPIGTTVRFQIRAADAGEDVDAAVWYGPEGPEGYYYSGARVNSSLNGLRFIQYRCYLDGGPGDTPTIDAVRIGYYP